MSTAMDMTHSVIDWQQVSVRLGAVEALKSVSFNARAGERIAIVGANGSGKSTLLRTVNGLLAPHAGTAQGLAPSRQAMLFQRPHLWRMAAWRQVALSLWWGGVPWRDAVPRAHAALAPVGLTEVANRSARALSGGQQQRLALACAWARQPALLLLDEPTASLDPRAQREVEALLHDGVHAATSAEGAALTLLFASHHLGQVKRLATRVLYMERGRLLADASVDVFFNPAALRALSPAAAQFVEGEIG